MTTKLLNEQFKRHFVGFQRRCAQYKEEEREHQPKRLRDSWKQVSIYTRTTNNMLMMMMMENMDHEVLYVMRWWWCNEGSRWKLRTTWCCYYSYFMIIILNILLWVVSICMLLTTPHESHISNGIVDELMIHVPLTAQAKGSVKHISKNVMLLQCKGVSKQATKAGLHINTQKMMWIFSDTHTLTYLVYVLYSKIISKSFVSIIIFHTSLDHSWISFWYTVNFIILW